MDRSIVRIDGSSGEGGGQIIRTAAALAARTGRAVEIENVRANRRNPGLRPQHVAAVEAVARACRGNLEGVSVGSRRIRLEPGPLVGGTTVVDTGTAGSTTLILHALAAVAPGLETPMTVEARGGTDQRWAPTAIHFEQVLVPTLARIGVRVDVLDVRPGFYPRGGGRLRARIHPARDRIPLRLEERTGEPEVTVRTQISRLPDHISDRVSRSTVRALEATGLATTSLIERVDALDPGVVVDAVARFENAILGSNALGARGVPSEVVGCRCGEALAAELASAATVDVHAADQLVPFVADVPGSTFVVREVTAHLETNIEVASRFVETEASLEPVEGGVRISF